MRVLSTDLPGVLIVEPVVHGDARGFFLETYHAQKHAALGINGPFVQDNHSRSVGRTVRGLHLQVHRPQGKLVRAVSGEIFDVAVDVRRGSPTFGHWIGLPLAADNFRQLYIPPGFAHGFSVLSQWAEVEYKCTEFYDPADEVGIAWNDPALGINWGVEEPILSDRDRRNQPLSAVLDRLPTFSTLL
jgi:dTDP-4-dehydrorhamnose 3,5-epimerase